MRECDNDDCEQEPYVGDDGVARVRWNHVPECEPSSSGDDEWRTYRYV